MAHKAREFSLQWYKLLMLQGGWIRTAQTLNTGSTHPSESIPMEEDRSEVRLNKVSADIVHALDGGVSA